MENFKIENVWLCEVSFIYRRQNDNMMILYESESKYVLVMKEEACQNGNVIPLKRRDYLLEKAAYFDLEGREYYHGTQKCVYNESDVGKTFVSERKSIPDEFLTEEEKETKTITAKRIAELQRRLQFHNC